MNRRRGDLTGIWRLRPGDDMALSSEIHARLGERGIEWEILPRLRERAIPVMAYCPFGQGALLREHGLRAFAERHGMTPAQAALAWLLDRGDVIAIPKTAHPERVAENRAALEIRLTDEQRAELEALFPPPASRSLLAIV